MTRSALRGSEGADEQDELPSLIFRETRFEDGHGLFAFAYFVEELPVGDAAHEISVGEVGGLGVVARGIAAIAFAGLAMTLRAFIAVDRASGFERARQRLQRIFELLGFLGNRPGPT